jgi:hypothetical protein
VSYNSNTTKIQLVKHTDLTPFNWLGLKKGKKMKKEEKKKEIQVKVTGLIARVSEEIPGFNKHFYRVVPITGSMDLDAIERYKLMLTHYSQNMEVMALEKALKSYLGELQIDYNQWFGFED